MKKVFSFVYAILCFIFVAYLSLPSLPFPEPPSDSVRSVEPADSETEERRAYFTNYTREQINTHYQQQYKLKIWGIEVPSYILVYPPEDAYVLIRDQTRSTHLREIVYPFRESLFINEFVAKEAKDDIWYKGVHFDQKVTVKIKSSLVVSRIVVGILTMSSLLLLFHQLDMTRKSLFSVLKKLKWPIFWQ